MTIAVDMGRKATKQNEAMSSFEWYRFNEPHVIKIILEIISHKIDYILI